MRVPLARSVGAYARLARLHRPTGFLLLMWPGWWAIALARTDSAAGWSGDWAEGARLCALFLAGAVVMRAAGCVWNDIADRDIDAKVARTRARPIAAGEISVARAAAFMAALALAGLAILLQLPAAAVWIGLASVAPIAPYPFMKRVTWWPQAWLGLTFAWGALLGWAAATGGLGWPAAALYAAAVAWTMGYDTIYAHQDKADDARIGVKSAALRLGARTVPAVRTCYALCVAGLAAAAHMTGAGWPAWAGLAAGAAVLAWQTETLDIDDPAGCARRFHANSAFAAPVFLGFLTG